MDQFFRFLGNKKAKGIRLAVMDMWKAFRNSTHANASQAAILFDKFHVMKQLGEVLDKVRKAEYSRLSGSSFSSSRARNIPCCRTRKTLPARPGRT